MSRIGKKPIPVQQGVKVQVAEREVTLAGPKGTLKASVHPNLSVEVADGILQVKRHTEAKSDRALAWPLASTAAEHDGRCHDRLCAETRARRRRVSSRNEREAAPAVARASRTRSCSFRPVGSRSQTPTQTSILISGIDKALVGQVAAKIRSFRPPEPYKGKGIKYEGERIRRKAGKAAAAGGAKS